MNPLLPKGLVLITGKMGSGKSLTMAMQALAAMDAGLSVHADFTIHPLEEAGKHYRFNCLDEFNKIHNSLILVDEAQSIGLNARRAMSKENISTMDIITNSRKRGNTVVLGSQIVIMVDTLCRQLADYMIVPYIEEVQGRPLFITWVIKEQRGFGDARNWCTVDILKEVYIPQYVLDSYSTSEIIDWEREDNKKIDANGWEGKLYEILDAAFPQPPFSVFGPEEFKSGLNVPVSAIKELHPDNAILAPDGCWYLFDNVSVTKEGRLNTSRKNHTKRLKIVEKFNNGWGGKMEFYYPYPSKHGASFDCPPLDVFRDVQRPSIKTIADKSISITDLIKTIQMKYNVVDGVVGAHN